MSFGFRVGVPGMRVRVSTRGVRASVGPRAARVNFGSGRTSVSTGMGPFFASTALSGGRRQTTTRRTSRSVGPSAAQLARAHRLAERAEQEAQRDDAIARLRQLRRDSTSVHLQHFPTATHPVIQAPPPLTLAWAESQAIAHALQGIGRFSFTDRSAAKEKARRQAPYYLSAEQQRLGQVHTQLQSQADQWWNAMLQNHEPTVCDAVNAAFSDNPAAGYAIGVDGSTLSVVMRQQDLDSLPQQTPGLTSAGRPTLKTLTKRDRMSWWLTIMASNLIATCKEAFAVAPSITEVNVAVLTRLPDTYRLGIVAYGTWTRRAVEAGRWQTPEDTLRCFDIGRDVRCSARITASGSLSSTLKPLYTAGVRGLERFLEDNTEDDGSDPLSDIDGALGSGNLASSEALPNVYDPVPFSTWLASSAIQQSTISVQEPAVAQELPAAQPLRMMAGQNVVLPELATYRVNIAFSFSGADADLTLLLLGQDNKVAGDDEFVFYNQPHAPGDTARLLGKSTEQGTTVERAVVHLSAMPARISSVMVSVNIDVASGLTCAAMVAPELSIGTTESAWVFTPTPDTRVKAMVVAEFYRHVVDGQPAWKMRAIGQGWDDGLDGLARAYGVDVD